MSIETDARQEAERRYPTRSPYPGELTYPRSALTHYKQGAFIGGAAWASEQANREPSDAEVEAAGNDLNHNSILACAGCGIPGGYIEGCEDCIRLCNAAARAALLAAQEVRLIAPDEQADREPSAETCKESAPDLARSGDVESGLAGPSDVHSSSVNVSEREVTVSDAEVEAAAQVLIRADWGEHYDDPLAQSYWHGYKEDARAALLAAKGVRR